MKECFECGQSIEDDDMVVRKYDKDFCSWRCVRIFRGEWQEEYQYNEEEEYVD